jgi:ABC-type multidrug transport system fused ATPase/permease subunit
MVDWSAFKRARSYLSARRWRILAAAFCAVTSAVCFAAIIVAVGELGELLFTPDHSLKPESLDRTSRLYWYSRLRANLYSRVGELPDTLSCMGTLLGALVLFAGIRSLCNYFQTRLIATVVTDATQRMRRAIYNQAYRLGTTEVSGIGAAPAINVFTRETDAVRDGLAAWLDAYVREPVKLVLLLTIALMGHWALASLFLILCLLGGFLAWRQIRSARARAGAALRSAAERLALLQESLFLLRLTRGYSL